MKFTINEKKKKGGVTLKLEGELTIYSVNEMKAKAVEALSNYSKIDIDMSDLTKIDTAGFQLYLVIKRKAIQENKVLRIKKTNDTVDHVFNFLGEAAQVSGA